MEARVLYPWLWLLALSIIVAVLFHRLIISRHAGKSFVLQSESSKLLPKILFNPLTSLWFLTYRILHALLPPDAQLQKLAASSWISDSLYMATKLGVSDALQKGPMTALELAKALPPPMHAGQMERLLRFLVTHGVYKFSSKTGQYSLTRVGALLCAEHPDCSRDMVLTLTDYKDTRLGWSCLEDAVRKGGFGFQHATGHTLWEYYDHNPELSQRSDRCFAQGSAAERAAAAMDYPKWCNYKSVVDVGGGSGTFGAELAKRYPHLQGHVAVMDRAAVARSVNAEAAKSLGLTFYPGDFFEKVEPEGADCYILKHIIHDWDDADSVRILNNVATAMESNSNSVLLIIDVLIEGPNDPLAMAKYAMDMQMMAACSGRERTRKEWTAILVKANLRLVKVHAIRHMFSILEIVKSL